MRHQVSNIGPTPINVWDKAGNSHRVEPGAGWIGEIWKVHNAIAGRVEYSVQPVEN